MAASALPLSGTAHASYSRAVPPDAAPLEAAAKPARAVVAAVARQPRHQAATAAYRPVRTSSLVLPLAAQGGRVSVALPPEEAAEPAPRLMTAVVRTVVQPAVVRASYSPAGGIDHDVRCVAQAVYHEARGEPLRGQRAVADVVMNRARSGRWGSSACSVVDARGQFSNRWSWGMPRIGVAAWDRAIQIARSAVAGGSSVSSRLVNFRAARMGGGAGAMRIGNHVFW